MVVQEEGVAVEGTRTLRVRASVCACASLTRRLRSAAKGGGGGGRGVGGETGGNGGQAGSSTARVRVGPSKAKLRHAGPSSNLCFSHSASPSLLSLLRAISVSLLRARSPSLFLSLSLSLSLALSPTLADYVSCAVFFLRLSVCLPASACRSVGSRFPPVFPSSDSRALSPCLSPGLAMYRWHGESTHQSADCGLLNARSHDPASGDVYTG